MYSSWQGQAELERRPSGCVREIVPILVGALASQAMSRSVVYARDQRIGKGHRKGPGACSGVSAHRQQRTAVDMGGFSNPLFQSVLEPFEESVGTGEVERRPSARLPSPDAPAQMDQQPQAKRKLSKSGEGRSLWHRKSSKKAAESTATNFQARPSRLTNSTLSLTTMDSVDTQDNDTLPSFLLHSIVPDPLGELPAWFKKESDMAAANVSTFRIRYPLHNPDGPRWYKNHHLIPASSRNPPPSFFSPSFPPMAASAHDLSEDSSRLPGPSRSPSGTPLPTPNSSQVRIPDIGGKPRSRKTSQDNVDLMDLSDPWGTHWHHESPYDAGTNNSPISVDSPEGLPRTRSRLSSLNAGQPRHKTVNPSPLSQSTSAVHLQPPETADVTRKLSKRRKPFAGLFGTSAKEPGSGEATSITSPDGLSAADRSSTVQNTLRPDAPRRHSILSPTSIALSSHSVAKKEKRGSVLGRLVRRFSVLRRTAQDPGAAISEAPEDEKGASSSFADEGPSRRSIVSHRQPSPEKQGDKKYSDPSKRIPPPRIDSDLLTQAENGRGPSTQLGREINDHRSSTSSDIPLAPLRKLTITNPDLPSSCGTTPAGENVNLPPEVPKVPLPQPERRDDGCPVLPMPVLTDKPPVEKKSPISPLSLPSSPVRTPSPAKGLLSPLTVPAPSPSVPEVAPANSSAHFIVRKHSPSSNKASPSTATPTSIPAFPPQLPQPSAEPVRPIPPHLIVPSIDDSPLSRASVLANPPTPCNNEEPNAQLPLPEESFRRSAASSAEKAKPTNETVSLSKSNSITSRKTETFRLVRSPSENKSLSESIMVEGEQWLLINGEDALRRRRTKDKGEKSTKPEKEKTERAPSRSKDRDGKREQKKSDKAEASDNRRRAGSHARSKSPPVEQVDVSQLSGRPSRARSLDGTQRPTLIQPMVFTLQGEPPRIRKSDDRQRDSTHSRLSRSGPSPVVTVARMERVPSSSARPTSELTSTADINSLKAREAWEMDRLWKGRSMYHGQPETTFMTSPPSNTREFRAPKVESSQRDTSHAVGHGSSHTSYVVQPLQAHPIPASVFYANMPSAPPPIIYAATSPYGHIPHASRDYSTSRSLPNFSFPAKETSSERSRNPLPAPPRESTYQPTRLPALADRSSGSASEYWTKYTSVPLQ